MSRRAQRKAIAAEGDDIIREAFAVFDTDKDGLISAADIATVIRALGKNPTQKEADEIAREAGGPANIDTVIKFAKRKFPTPLDQDAGMRAAFQALDKDGNGKIQEAELRQILTTLGEALPLRELDLILREVETDNFGGIYYDAFVDKLIEGL